MKGFYTTSLCELVIKDEAYIPMKTMWELLTGRGQVAGWGLQDDVQGEGLGVWKVAMEA